MAQIWNIPPAGTDRAGPVIKTNIPNALESLRTLHSGATAPTSTVAYMFWADTSAGLLKQRDGADSAWATLGPLGANLGRYTVRTELVSLSATQTRRIWVPPSPFLVTRLVLVSSTASTSSSGNEWRFHLHNQTTAVDLMSGNVGTFTALAGVGGGYELAVDTVWPLIPDQNQALAADDVLGFSATKVGTATTLAELAVFVEGHFTG